MLRQHFASAAVAACTLSMLVVVGCASDPAEDVDVTESAATPTSPATNFDLAATCARNFKRHSSVRATDMAQGVIRWSCGDVPGVTNDDLGQEYCEYQAVQNGVIRKQASEIDPNGPPVSCVFTSVFTGAGQEPQLKAAMADPANLGVAARMGITQMYKRFNSRGAAAKLINDCTNAAPSPMAVLSLRMELRTAACYTAWAKGGPQAAELINVCKGNLARDSVWAQAQALGAKIAEANDEDFEAQHDISSCMTVRRAGVSWRNSDPMICSRVARSADECSCKFNAIPDSVVGLPFTGWVDHQLPTGCRLAKVNGEDYPYIAICSLTAQEISDLPLIPLYAGNLGNFCHDRFAVDLVMKLPLRALQTQGTCQKTAGFCEEYMGKSEPVPPKTGEGRDGSGSTDSATNRSEGAPPAPPGAGTPTP